MNLFATVLAISGVACFVLGARWGTRNGRRARADSLTGAVGRKEAMRHLDSILRRPRRRGYTVGVAFCDVDALKKVNDTHGHQAGDRVLMAVATRMREALRPSDLVARLGGDEFLAICDGVRTPADMELLARRLKSAVATAVPFAVSDLPTSADAGLIPHNVSVSVSIGTATSDVATSDAADLIARADQAMYRNKRIHEELPMGAGPLSPIRAKVR